MIAIQQTDGTICIILNTTGRQLVLTQDEFTELAIGLEGQVEEDEEC